MIGGVFGRLTVVEGAGATKKRELLWRCKCFCGGEKTTTGYLLRSGQSRSCGCLQKEKASISNKARTQHPGHPRVYRDRIYRIWSGMRMRCQNNNNPQFADYGGRGISICQEWDDFATFAAWAELSGYRDDLSIDRIDNNGNYEPANCRWATKIEQSRNKRPRKDQKLTDAQVEAIRTDNRFQYVIARDYGIHQQHVSRIKNGKRRAFPTEGVVK